MTVAPSLDYRYLILFLLIQTYPSLRQPPQNYTSLIQSFNRLFPNSEKRLSTNAVDLYVLFHFISSIIGI